MSAASYKRIIGANDRINIGFLGCGARSDGHQNIVKMSFEEKNLGVVAVCDIWQKNKERAAARCKDKCLETKLPNLNIRKNYWPYQNWMQ